MDYPHLRVLLLSDLVKKSSPSRVWLLNGVPLLAVSNAVIYLFAFKDLKKLPKSTFGTPGRGL